MKRTTIFTILFLSAAAFARAQVAGGSVSIENLAVEHAGDSVTVSYTATVAPRGVKRDRSLIFSPVIAGGGFRQSLPPVVVHGGGSALARSRREVAFGTTPGYDNALTTKNGKTITTSASVPFQEWMRGAEIVFESVAAGCCAQGAFESVVMARNTLPAPVTVSPALPEPEPEWIAASVADSLSVAFRFVIPFSEFDENEPLKLYDDDIENDLEIYFRVAKYSVEPEYMDNAHTLNNLIACIDMIAGSADSRVARIVIAGFASPEGNFEFNHRLAFERAVSLKRYIMERSGIPDRTIMLFNGGVDWRGLRAMIEKSRLPEKGELISVIDNTPVGGEGYRAGRLEQIRRMKGGQTYRLLLSEYFPYLRSGAFIKVFYENE